MKMYFVYFIHISYFVHRNLHFKICMVTVYNMCTQNFILYDLAFASYIMEPRGNTVPIVINTES